MAGYNTVSEVLRSGRPALLVPRVRPSREQALRAELLRRAGRAEVLYPHELDAERMRSSLDRLLSTVPHAAEGDHGGAGRAVDVLERLACASTAGCRLAEAS